MAKLTRYHAALQTLLQAPKNIEVYQSQYQSECVRIDDPRNWMLSKEYRDKQKDNEKLKLQSKIGGLVSKMRSALDVVREAEELKNQKLDLSNKQLSSAISLIQMLGSSLDAADQDAMIEQFRGDLPSLRLIGQLFRKNGLEYSANQCEDACKQIPERVLDDYQYVIDGWFEDLIWDESHIFWSKQELSSAMKRLGLDADANPYEAAMRDLRDVYGIGSEERKTVTAGLDMLNDETSKKAESDIGKKQMNAEAIFEAVRQRIENEHEKADRETNQQKK